MQGMKGGSNSQPLIDIDLGCLGAQGPMVDETPGFVDNKQVEKCHGCLQQFRFFYCLELALGDDDNDRYCRS